jgi:hypothetical protein
VSLGSSCYEGWGSMVVSSRLRRHSACHPRRPVPSDGHLIRAMMWSTAFVSCWKSGKNRASFPRALRYLRTGLSEHDPDMMCETALVIHNAFARFPRPMVHSFLDPGWNRIEFAIQKFVPWYCSEPRLALNRIVVTRYPYSDLGPAKFQLPAPRLDDRRRFT